MKLHTEHNEIERSNVASETTFRIKTTAKAFDILSSGLYTDPKLAIVRELSCNAYDAHVAAGKADVPFEIHLPNSLEPWFHVRDHGTGLSDEDVMSLYTTYFDSTKSNSNDYIGALGLGSKSPFSYTKAFEVISRFNGMRRTYSVFINEDGIPSIARLGEIHTDEHNGLEVRITIQSSDFYSFMEKTSHALRWFPIKPVVTGYPNFKFQEVPQQHLEGDSWKMFESGFASNYTKMTAVQGNVAYKVDIGKLGLSTSDIKILENSHVVGFFKIGELEVAANREEIRYDDRSKAALVAKIASVRAGVLKSVEQAVEALAGKPFWNVVIELNALAQKLFHDRHLFKEFVKDTTNEKILEYIKIGGTFQTEQLKGHEISCFEKGQGSNIKRKQWGNGITPETHVSIFYNDLPSGGVARAMEWVRQQYNGSSKGKPLAVVIRPIKDYADVEFDGTHTGKILNKKKWTQKDYKAEIVQLQKELGDYEFKLTSRDCPVPARAKSTYSGELPIFQFSGIQGKYKQYIAWKRTPSIDLSEGGLYFAIENGAHISFTNKKGEIENVNWQYRDVESNLIEAVKLVNEYLKTNYSVKNLYGFGSQAINKVKRNEKWVNIFDVLRLVVKSYVEPVNFFNNLERTSDAHGVRSRCTKNDEFVTLVKGLDKKSTFRKVCLPLIEDFQKYSKYARTVRFVKQIDVDLKTEMLDNKVTGYFDDKAFEEYPMFKFVNNIDYHKGKELKVLFDYIQLIDRS